MAVAVAAITVAIPVVVVNLSGTRGYRQEHESR
jgi:hypothetical protein